MGVFRNFPYTNFHELNLDEILKLIKKLSEEWNDFTINWEKDIYEQVNNWLEAHPEAITTVQDWSLKSTKLVKGTLGFVTPEMFGAIGDGITDDTVAFNEMFDSNEKIIIPYHEYNITEKIFNDESNIISDNGIYVNNKPVISRQIAESTPNVKLFKYKPFSELDITNDFQSATYDTLRTRIIMGFNDSNDSTLSHIIAISNDFNEILERSDVNAYHINDMTYNPVTDEIYIATMNEIDPIAVIDPKTLLIKRYINVDFVAYEISYDNINDIYYIVGNGNLNVYTNNWELIKSYPFSNDDIANVIGQLKTGIRPENIVNQASIAINGQFGLISNITEYAKYGYALMTQFDYKSGSVKKVYGWIPIGYSNEVETVIHVNDTFYAIGYEPTPIKRLVITRLVVSDNASLENFTPLEDDANLVLRRDRLTVTQERCEIVSGGYATVGDFVFINMRIKILTTLDAPNYWEVMRGFISPEMYTLLQAGAPSNKPNHLIANGVPFMASIDGAGILRIHTDMQLLPDDELYISGWYLRYLYNQGNR